MMKKFLLIFLLLLTTACGFKPMFTGQDMDIYVPPISGINGIDLRNALWAEFGGQHEPGATYTLKVVLQTPRTSYRAYDRTGTATWQEISMTAKYTLERNGKVIAHGTEQTAESYTLVSYLVASNASYNNAVQNAVRVLADKISARVVTETHRYETTDAKSKK